MNVSDYKDLSPFEVEILERILKLQGDVNYVKSIAKRLEKELPDED